MSETVRLQSDRGGIARIIIDNAPLNALSHGVRQGLASAVERAEADDTVRAIVIEAAGRTFPAGADSGEFDGIGGRARAPDLRSVCAAIEDCTKPVVAAIQGSALGGGFELALAAHYRIAAPQAHMALPEVNLGLIPGADGTQRLPRIAGARVALEILQVGRPVGAAEALRLGLIDRIAEGPLAEAAIGFAEELLQAGAGPRRSRDRTEGLADPKAYQQAVQEQLSRAAGSPLLARQRIVEAVEAAQLMPFAAGSAFEAAAYEECRDTAEARALRYAFIAEKRAGRMPEFEGLRPRTPVRAALAGDGAASVGWAVLLLDAGLQLTLHAAEPDVLRAGIANIYRQAVQGGRLAEALRDERLARLAGSAGPGALGEADLVLATDPVAAADLEAAMRDDAILALATGSGQVPDFSSLARPERALALQVPGLPHRLRLVEVLAGDDTAPEVALSAVQTLRRASRVPVVSPAAEGGIGPAVWGACVFAAESAVRAGAAAEAVEGALADYGWRRSPFEARPAPARGGSGGPGPRDIQQRCLAAMANVGALLVEAGVAQRPADVDMVMIHGYGFPAWRGGPMEAADLSGLLQVQTRLRALTGEDAEFWAPSALFGDLIKNGRRFADLNRL